MKIDGIVKNETMYVALVSIVFSLFLQAVFIVSGNWNYTVLLGNILGFSTSVLNFFLLGLTLQNAVKKDDEKAKSTVRTSHILRNFLVFGLTVLGVVLPIFNTVSVIISLFFVRLGFLVRPVLAKRKCFSKVLKNEN